MGDSRRVGPVRQLLTGSLSVAMLAGSAVIGCGSDSTLSEAGPSGGAGGEATTVGPAVTIGTAQANTSAAAGGGTELLGPPYPIVLSHGFFGFEDFAGAGFLTYFNGVRHNLEQHGEPLVFTPAVDPFNDSTTRGAQLSEAISQILADTGYEKVNIIGHSQGGLDARVVAFEHPEMVASVITLQTPHGGTPVADIALQIISDPGLADLLDLLVQIVGQPLYDQVGSETSLAKALEEFSSDGIAIFNAHYTDQPGIYYASLAGRSDWHSGGSDCQVANPPAFVSEWASERDPIDPLFSVSEAILDGGLGAPFPNDGLVRARDAKWGHFLGCLPADHMDLIGQLFADSPGFGNDWDYQQFYVDLVQHIRDQGL